MATDYELEILERYSSPGLKRNQLTRYGKMWHLMDTCRMSVEERNKFFDEMYGKEKYISI